jgi:hypothetical protein
MRSGAALEAAVGVGVIVLLAAHARIFDAGQAWATIEAVGAVVAVVVAVGGIVGAVVPSRRSDRLVVGCSVDDVRKEYVDEGCRNVTRVAVLGKYCVDEGGRNVTRVAVMKYEYSQMR